MAKTDNLNLNVISKEDDLLVVDFFQQISGTEDGSNMLAIDDAVTDLENSLVKYMSKSDYDPDGEIEAAGGFAAWMTSNYDIAEEMSY